MLKRLLPCSLMLVMMAASAHAGLRSPQVPVSGSALATFFASQGQSIDVNTQQLDLQQLSTDQTGFEVHTFDLSSSLSEFGAYNAGVVTPSLYAIAYAQQSPGYFELAAFRVMPARLSVMIFDESGGTPFSSTYVGADGSNFGFFVEPNAGVALFTQDARNAGGAPHLLAFAGTGTRSGWTWLACETGTSAGGDFADFVALVQLTAPAPVPVNHSSWGRVKKLYR